MVEHLSLKAWWEKYIRPYSLGLALLISVLLRILAAVYLGNDIDPLPGTHDQISYDALAQSILKGNGYQFSENWYPFTPAGTPTAHWSFAYPLFLAGIYYLVGYYPLVARIIQGIIGGVLISLLIYDIGRRLEGKPVAVVGAFLAAIYGYFVYYNVSLMTETFFIVLVLLSLHLVLKMKDDPSLGNFILFGVTQGVAILFKQTTIFVFPVFLLWLLWTLRGKVRVWHFAVPVGLVVLFVLPWTIRNQRVYDHFLLLNSNSGYALFASNHPKLGTQWQNEDIVTPIPEQYGGLNEAELNDALTGEAIRFVVDNPGRYILLTLSKSLEYFKFWPSSASGLTSNIVRVFSYGVYLPFMLWGLILAFPRWRDYLPLFLFVAIHTALHLLSWPAPRYRLPVDAVMMPVAAIAVIEFSKRLKHISDSRFIQGRFVSKLKGLKR
jgi:4-amino-4-deoxy-L-arabinose transferase-like glycosyltransferase